MRTRPRNATLRTSAARVTKHGRSPGPNNGAHSTAAPFSCATEVNVPHSCVTSGAVPMVKSAPTKRIAAAAKPDRVRRSVISRSPSAHRTTHPRPFFQKNLQPEGGLSGLRTRSGQPSRGFSLAHSWHDYCNESVCFKLTIFESPRPKHHKRTSTAYRERGYLPRLPSSWCLPQLLPRHNLRPQFHSPCIVHPEQLHSRAPDRRRPLDPRALKNEVIGPPVAPWMKQLGHGVVHRIDPRDVGTFAVIATMAGEGKILRIVCPAVTLRPDVLDVVRQPGMRLRQAAILA